MLKFLNNAIEDYKGLDRKILFILFGLFLISLGNYIIVPYLAVFLVQSKHVSMSVIALVISMRLLSQRGLTLLGGHLIDYFGSKIGMLLGVLVRALSFIILAISTDIKFLFIFALLNGLGSALYQPSAKTALALITPSDQRHRVFGIRNIAINAGVSIGPLLGALLFSVSFQVQVLFSSLIYFIIFIIGCNLLPNDRKNTLSGANKLSYADLFKNKQVVSLLAIQFFYFILYSQFELTLPVYVAKNIGQYAAGLMFTINAITVVFLQQTLSMKLKKLNSIYYSFQAGIVFTMLGIVILLLSRDSFILGYPGLLLGTVIFSVGEIVMTVMVDVAATEIMDSSVLGRGFSLLSLTAALASVFGNSFFGWMYDFPEFIFIVIMFFIFVYTIAHMVLKRFKPDLTVIDVI